MIARFRQRQINVQSVDAALTFILLLGTLQCPHYSIEVPNTRTVRRPEDAIALASACDQGYKVSGLLTNSHSRHADSDPYRGRYPVWVAS